MSDESNTGDPPPPRRSKLPLILGLVLMPALAGGGFYATYSGLVLAPQDKDAAAGGAAVEQLPDIAFVPIDPMVVALGADRGGRYLHFTGQIEVAKAHEAEARLILPRIMDVLNGYLRAVAVSELEDPVALVRLRAQMLRRVQMVSGEGRVRDLLVTEFVIN